uniref:Uncharacterized protein n=1 Tax=Oryza punctata TaxID=4537 RepID=A0A0E0M5H4_ORYPU
MVLFCAKSSWHVALRSARVPMASATAACTRMGGSLSAAAKTEHTPAWTSLSMLSSSQPSRPSARAAASCPSSVPSLSSLSSGGTPSSSMMSLAKCWLSRAREARLAAESARAASPPVWRRATWSQMRNSMGSFCAMLGSPLRSPSSASPSSSPPPPPERGEEMRRSQATSSSAVSRRPMVRGNPAAGLSVKRRLSRGWALAQRAAREEALRSACWAPAMMRAAGRSYRSARAAWRSSAASLSALALSSPHSARKHRAAPHCLATSSASWIGRASIAFTPSPISPGNPTILRLLRNSPRNENFSKN